MSDRAPLVLVSNRGPVTYQDDGSVKRGTGGLVTALTGLASHRDAIWIASAMTEADAEKTRQHDGRPFEVEAPEGGEFRVRFVESDPEAYDRFYSIIANPMLWFIQHYLWDQSNAPDIRRHEVEAFEAGYNVVNRDLADCVLEQIADQDEPVVMVHDYHFYTLPEMIRAERPDVFLHHFIHIPWTQSDAWKVLPSKMREEIFRGVLANDIVGFHTRSYRRNFLQCCRDLLDLDVDMDAGVVRVEDREVWVRAYPLPIDYEATRALAARDRVAALEERVLARRRDYSILRVDRADLSKNVLRGFTAFDIFLEQHPEFAERITFTAQLMPSRTDVPEYAEYLERIEALVAVVNHRHGTPDWMPIDLKLRDDLDEAVASYKHYDVMMVNAMFDGMNLVAKEGPLVNERDGVSILSENTGAHEELGEFALSVNPFDVQELADAIYAALTMSGDERKRRARGLKEIVTSRDPGDWIDEQIADIRKKADGRTAAG
jgi:trehalose 6-phosphate synthase